MPSKPIRPQDLLVQYRDKTLKRQGSIPINDLRLKFQPVFNGVGSWQLQLPAEHRAVPYLRTPGSGIVVTNLATGQTLLSGPTSAPSKKATKADPKGLVTIAGLTDDRLLWDARAFPDPQGSADPALQTKAYDIRTGNAEAIMRQYVAYNVCNGAIALTGPVTWALAGRLAGFRNYLRLQQTSANLGPSMTRRARFDVLGELIYGIAVEAGLGFRIVQVGLHLEFQVYQPTNRSRTIRLDVKNGTLNETNVETAPADITREIIAGQGEGELRKIKQFTTTESLQSETDWGLVIEDWQDQRNTNDDAELQSAAMERLLESGFTKVAVKATPAQDQTMVFMTDFFLGDKVAMVIDGQEQPNSIITEAAIIVDDQGIDTAIAVGNIADFDSSSALRQTVTDTVNRVEALERTSELRDAAGIYGKLITDCNAAIDAGWYYGVSPVNGPTSTGLAQIMVYRGGATNNAIRQEFRRIYADSAALTGGATDNRVWIRTSVDGGLNWTPWRREPRGPHSGTTTDRNNHRPDYLEEWYDTSLDQLFIGSKTGTWRRKSGQIAGSTVAWDNTSTVTGFNAGARTAIVTLPTFLEENEWPLIQSVSVGSGYGMIGVTAIIRNATTTQVSVRFFQAFSTTTQALAIVWQILVG